MTDTEISILDRCTGKQLKELLALASNTANATRNWLLEIGDLDALEYLLTGMCAGTGESAGALLQAVCSADTPVEVLVGVKSSAKRLATAAEDPAQKAAATLLYHLSVAAALGRHGRNISSKDSLDRLPLYRELAAELTDDKLAAIFEKAVAHLDSPSR
jgi:rubrerythrin